MGFKYHLGCYAGRSPLCFGADIYLFIYFFFAAYLWGRSVDRYQTLPNFRWWLRFIRFDQKFEAPFSRKNWRPENVKISVIWRLRRKYFRITVFKLWSLAHMRRPLGLLIHTRYALAVGSVPSARYRQVGQCVPSFSLQTANIGQ